MLAWSFPISKLLALDQTITNKLTQLILSRSRSRLDLLSSPHGHELLIFNHKERGLLIDKGCLGLAR